MSIREGTSRKVSFDTRDELGDKIDKLTVILGRLAAKDSKEKRPLNPRYIKAEEDDKTEVMVKGIIKIGIGYVIDQIAKIEDSLDKREVDPDLSRGIEETISEIILEFIEVIIIGLMAIVEVGIGLKRDHSQETIAVTEVEVQAIVD